MAKTRKPIGIDDPALLTAYAEARRFLRRKNVTGLSIGSARCKGAQEDGLAIRIHVTRKLGEHKLSKSSIFPRFIKGFRIDVIESNYGAHSLSDAETSMRRITRAFPASPGVQISSSNGSFGTFGMVVTDNQSVGRQQCILTAAHVFQDVPANSPVHQPSSNVPANLIGYLGRQVWGWKCEAAIAPINNRAVSNKPLLGTQGISKKGFTRIRQVKDGDILVKSGCMTGLTKAKVDGVGEHLVVYDGYPSVMINGFHLVPINLDGSVPWLAGDSGSVWYDENTGEAVGLHIAGDIAGTHPWAFACHLTTVFSELDIGFISLP